VPVEPQQTSSGAEGRLIYLVENLASLHASPDLAWIAGRFEFLGEKALGASLTVLALPDETGAYRAAASASPRTAVARGLWEELGIDRLPSNTAAAAAFGGMEVHARPARHALADLFPRCERPGGEEAVVVPVAFSGELIGVGVFVIEADEMTEAMASILASNTAVAMYQLRQREEARRLHSVDPLLWIPDEQFLVTQLRREVARARRYAREVGVGVLRFESEAEVRAQFGDFYTDHLMRRIGSQVLAGVRDSDVLGALDGGYAVIHAETPLDGTRLSTERLRDAVLRMIEQKFPELTAPRISVSAVAYPATAATVEELLLALQADAGAGADSSAA
jgi:diguanylate cyclase (GGDEF)-like protein